MNKLSIEDQHYSFILETLKKFLPNAKLYLFGSRAKKNHQKYSDIDIAIDNQQSINAEILCKIVSEFENSTLPYEIDIVDLYTISENFKSAIENELVLIN